MVLELAWHEIRETERRRRRRRRHERSLAMVSEGQMMGRRM